MKEVVGVRFKGAGKIYYFDPLDLDIDVDDNVIVETARGIEFGQVVLGRRNLKEEDRDLLDSLKPVIRVASEEDKQIHEDNIVRAKEAKGICKDKVKEHGLEMNILDVEYTFDNNKLIFYFTAEGRIDFRDLVKDLAAIFRTRIELRQIGVRDEAKLVGGMGSCGNVCCCKKFLGEFAPVSIQMAKDQDLSLNPSKISGVCGRLMCCLKYEHETYEDILDTMPEIGEKVLTPMGEGIIVETIVLLEQVKVRVRLEDNTEDIIKYDLEDIKVRTKNKCKGCSK